MTREILATIQATLTARLNAHEISMDEFCSLTEDIAVMERRIVRHG